jgi:hypothetical protein
MMHRKLVAVLGCVLAFGGAAAAAGKARLEPGGDEAMQVHLVRSAEPGCEPQCPEWIAAQGRIEAGSAWRFRRVLRRLGRRKVPVLIDSNGGSVSAAFEIGRLIRAHGLDAVVSRTDLIQCAAADVECRRRARKRKIPLGLPRADYAKCASSCAFVLAAGAHRLVGPTAFVGVHQIRSFYVYARVLRTYRVTATSKRLVSERRVTEKVVETPTPPKTYEQIRRYFGEMGVSEAIMPMILETPGDQLHWLTRAELEATGLATGSIDGERLLIKAVAPAAERAVVTPQAGDTAAVAVPVGAHEAVSSTVSEKSVSEKAVSETVSAPPLKE